MIQSHFIAALLFSAVTSVVFGVTSKDTDRERLLYGLWVFGVFIVVTFGLSWLMYAGHK
jgi:hypothetical protein